MSLAIHHTGATSLAGRIAALAGGLARNVARRRAVAQTLNELERLSDRDLADIGLSRGELREAAERAVSGQTRF